MYALLEPTETVFKCDTQCETFVETKTNHISIRRSRNSSEIKSTSTFFFHYKSTSYSTSATKTHGNLQVLLLTELDADPRPLLNLVAY